MDAPARALGEHWACVALGHPHRSLGTLSPRQAAGHTVVGPRSATPMGTPPVLPQACCGLVSGAPSLALELAPPLPGSCQLWPQVQVLKSWPDPQIPGTMTTARRLQAQLMGTKRPEAEPSPPILCALLPAWWRLCKALSNAGPPRACVHRPPELAQLLCLSLGPRYCKCQSAISGSMGSGPERLRHSLQGRARSRGGSGHGGASCLPAVFEAPPRPPRPQFSRRVC